MNEIRVVSDLKDSFEYFCNCCGQLRLSLTGNKVCGHCESTDLVIGKPGELDKDALKEEYERKQS